MNWRRTVVYMVLLAILVGVYLFLKTNKATTEAKATVTPAPTENITYLFPAEAGTPSSIRLEAKSGETVEFALDANKAWTLIQPVKTKADPASAEAAASQITTIRVLDTVPSVDLKIAGLDVPEYVLTVKFTSGVERTVNVGVLTPSESGYYVFDTTGKVVIVSRDGIDALLGLLKNPPYAETPTASPSPAAGTETTIPVGGATATPQP